MVWLWEWHVAPLSTSCCFSLSQKEWWLSESIHFSQGQPQSGLDKKSQITQMTLITQIHIFSFKLMRYSGCGHSRIWRPDSYILKHIYCFLKWRKLRSHIKLMYLEVISWDHLKNCFSDSKLIISILLILFWYEQDFLLLDLLPLKWHYEDAYMLVYASSILKCL